MPPERQAALYKALSPADPQLRTYIDANSHFPAAPEVHVFGNVDVHLSWFWYDTIHTYTCTCSGTSTTRCIWPATLRPCDPAQQHVAPAFQVHILPEEPNHNLNPNP